MEKTGWTYEQVMDTPMNVVEAFGLVAEAREEKRRIEKMKMESESNA